MPANFFYFAFPVSPARYARLLKPSSNAIKSVDPSAKILLSGLFGDPKEGGAYGRSAADFLNALYRVPRIERYFDAVALHPYAFHVEDLEEMVEDVRAVMLENDDPGARLRITEMGWGSEDNSQVVAFEQGIQGQKQELKSAYKYLLANRRRLKLDGAYWFTWKDSNLYCTYCDSVGFFSEGSGLLPKPAWYAFVKISGGRAWPLCRVRQRSPSLACPRRVWRRPRPLDVALPRLRVCVLASHGDACARTGQTSPDTALVRRGRAAHSIPPCSRLRHRARPGSSCRPTTRPTTSRRSPRRCGRSCLPRPGS